jgi:hypothetical protein
VVRTIRLSVHTADAELEAVVIEARRLDERRRRVVPVESGGRQWPLVSGVPALAVPGVVTTGSADTDGVSCIPWHRL